jgi:hypothetical protein
MFSILAGHPEIDSVHRAAIARDYEMFSSGLPDALESLCP